MSATDFKAWIADLASDDDKVSASGRRRLVAQGSASIPHLLTLFAQTKNVAQYRGALRILGDLARSATPQQIVALRGQILTHLKNCDGAERRSLITCLGHLGVDAAAESALLPLWKEEKRDDQLRVLAAALGGVGGEKSITALESRSGTAPLVGREVTKSIAAIKARTVRAAAGDGKILGDKIIYGVRIRLCCRRGLSGLLLKHLPSTVRRARETAPGQVDGELHGSLDSLLACRLWSEMFFVEPSIHSALSGNLLRTLTAGAATWRLHLPGASRGQLLDKIHLAQSVAPDLPNSPSGAVWELRPSVDEVEILPRFWPDTRFNYLRETIPAMTHAPLAAALAALSKPVAGDIVWDPFCGAGTELAERAKAGPYARLIGSDRDPKAIEAAKKNLSGTERVALEIGDAFEWKHKDVNVLLTNPPYGRKIQGDNNAMLLRRVLETAAANMPRGKIILCSPMPRQTWIWAIELGWKAVTRHEVGADGHLLEVQVFARE